VGGVTVPAVKRFQSRKLAFEVLEDRIVPTAPWYLVYQLPQTNYEGDAVSLNVAGDNLGGDPVNLNVTGLPSGLSLTYNDIYANITGVIAAGAAASSPYAVTVAATDTVTNVTTNETIDWTVNQTIVTLTNPGNQTNVDGQSFGGLQVSASDTASHPVVFSAAGLPSGLTIDPSTGTIGGNIANNASLNTPYSSTVTATDTAAGVSGSTTFSWVVNATVVLTNPGDQTNQGLDSVNLPLSTYISNGSTPNYTATGLPSGLSISGGAITGTIAENDGANYTASVSVTATDPYSGVSYTVGFNWLVESNVYYTVDDLGDAGTGSGNVGDLRYCINSINESEATASSFYISFSVSGTISLNASFGALPALAGKTFNIAGTGITVDAGDNSGIFYIDSDATAEIDNIALANAANAPAVVNYGTLKMVGGTTSNCLAGADGNDGTEELDDRSYIGNRGVNGGAIQIRLNDTETLNGDTFVNNSAIGLSSGGAIWNDGSTTITNCNIGLNSATSGGAIANSQRLTITGTYIYSNWATQFGGGIYNYNTGNLTIGGSSEIFRNWSNEGGGIYNTSLAPGFNATVRIFGATIDFNTATDSGGGIYNDAIALLGGAVVDNNSTDNGQGGGIYASANATTTIIWTSFDGNACGAANGGNAIYQSANGKLYLLHDGFGANQDVKP
jgi:hypothetical protein